MDLVHLAQVRTLPRAAVKLLFPLRKMSSDSDEYEVEKILDVRVNERIEEFLIKWKDYDE